MFSHFVFFKDTLNPLEVINPTGLVGHCVKYDRKYLIILFHLDPEIKCACSWQNLWPLYSCLWLLSS